jgi:hypothetical protein
VHGPFVEQRQDCGADRTPPCSAAPVAAAVAVGTAMVSPAVLVAPVVASVEVVVVSLMGMLMMVSHRTCFLVELDRSIDENSDLSLPLQRSEPGIINRS